MDILRIDILPARPIYRVQVAGWRGDHMDVFHNDQPVQVDRQEVQAEPYTYYVQRANEVRATSNDTISVIVGAQKCVVTLEECVPLRPTIKQNDDGIATIYWNGIPLEEILKEDFLSVE